MKSVVHEPAPAKRSDFIWSALLHMGSNMWSDQAGAVATKLAFDLDIWHEQTWKLHDIGFNQVIIDLGEALVYPSHPELAVKGSWMPARMKTELARLRKLGLEPIPKLNFSACHDIWLKEYSFQLSTPEYYRVCADVIRDTCEIFGSPRFFHLGMDEETAAVQAGFRYVAVRQGELWWHDMLFLVSEVERHGARAMMWGDPAWEKRDFTARMPRSVLPCNWYYWNETETLEANDWKSQVEDGRNRGAELKTFIDLEKAGFEQLPCVSSYYEPDSMESVVRYCKRRIAPKRFLGVLFAPWGATTPKKRWRTDRALPYAARIIREFDGYEGFRG